MSEHINNYLHQLENAIYYTNWKTNNTVCDELSQVINSMYAVDYMSEKPDL